MITVKALLRGAAALACMGAGTAAYAQNVPPPAADPGAIGRGLIDQRRDLPPPPEPDAGDPVVGEAFEPAPDQPAAPATTFELNAVTFDSSAFLSQDELDALASPWIGRQVSLNDLRTIAAEVNAIYASRGIATARAYVPPQTIADGAVRIALIEGRLGELQVGEGRYISPDYVRSRLTIVPGEILDLERLRRDVTAFNRTNDVRLQAQLQPGSEVGLTDVLVSLIEPPRNSVQLFADSHGYQSTGRYQGGIALRSNSLLLDGDRASVFASASNGALTASASYNVPLGMSRIGVSYARSQIQVTQGPSASLDIKGFSDTASINFARPVAERPGWHSSVVASLSYAASKSKLSDTTVGKSSVYKATGGFSFGFDVEPGTIFGLNLTASVTSAEDSLETDTRTFPMFNADMWMATQLAPRLSLRAAAAGQYVVAEFIPSNQLFQVGGPNTIRGFQPGAASGRSGFYTQAELHYLAPVTPRGVDLFAFLDSGKAYSPDFGNRGLASTGVGMRLPLWRFDLEATYGVALTSLNPGEDRHRADMRLVLSF